MSHYDVAHLQPTTSVPTKYQLPTPYPRSMSLQQDQRSNQGHAMMLHTYTP